MPQRKERKAIVRPLPRWARELFASVSFQERLRQGDANALALVNAFYDYWCMHIA